MWWGCWIVHKLNKHCKVNKKSKIGSYFVSFITNLYIGSYTNTIPCFHIWHKQNKLCSLSSKDYILKQNLLKILLQSVPIQEDMRQHLMTSCCKPSCTHRIAVIPSSILSDLHLRDSWLGYEGSQVRNRDKTSFLLFPLLSCFIHPSFPCHIKIQSVLGLSCWKLLFLNKYIHSVKYTPKERGLVYAQ